MNVASSHEISQNYCFKSGAYIAANVILDKETVF
jgi:hypothetical protein